LFADVVQHLAAVFQESSDALCM